MSENPIPYNAIIAKKVQLADNGVLVNGQPFPTLSFTKSQEMHEIAKQIDAPVCHTEGDKTVCFVAPKLGRIVQDSERTKQLLEDIALNSLSILEQNAAPREFIDRQLGIQINRIEDMYSRLKTDKGRNKARHDVISFLKSTSSLIPEGALNNVVFEAGEVSENQRLPVPI